MTILDEIVAHKKKEVELNKKDVPLRKLEKGLFFDRNTLSLKKSLFESNTPGIISEFKRKSPSKGIINKDVTVEEVTSGYSYVGAKAISVLTDYNYFGGTANDLSTARKFNDIPILRKDFIVDEYQIYEAKAIGADLILLISACLTSEEVKRFSSVAKSLNLEILFEVHNEEELNSLVPEIDLVGVNNRNLKTFEVDVNISKDLANVIPKEFIKISESGLSEAKTIIDLYAYGFKGFLMGEAFMKFTEPHYELEKLINDIELLLDE